MALYLGSDKFKINFDGALYNLNLFSSTPILSGIQLLSSDNYILRDTSGLYLIPKEQTYLCISLDNYLLTDINGTYLTIEESE